jgi:gliding motility-associated lipoprotein GldD
LNNIKSIVVKAVITSFTLVLLISCKKDVLPKPSSQLRLDYKSAKYAHFENECPFTFDINQESIIKGKTDCNFTINYPKMKATIYLSYKPVQNNINVLLKDAQKLTYEHVIKADDILEQPFINSDHRVYGMFYQVNGNAATNAQFYVTDSVKHFLDCSVYFYAKPNFDSVMPAASYVKNDMQRLMESLRWK